MATVVNLASDETLVKEAYARVKGDWAGLAGDQLLQVNRIRSVSTVGDNLSNATYDIVHGASDPSRAC
jgi:hypothetical protein